MSESLKTEVSNISSGASRFEEAKELLVRHSAADLAEVTSASMRSSMKDRLTRYRRYGRNSAKSTDLIVKTLNSKANELLADDIGEGLEHMLTTEATLSELKSHRETKEREDAFRLGSSFVSAAVDINLPGYMRTYNRMRKIKDITLGATQGALIGLSADLITGAEGVQEHIFTGVGALAGAAAGVAVSFVKHTSEENQTADIMAAQGHILAEEIGNS